MNLCCFFLLHMILYSQAKEHTKPKPRAKRLDCTLTIEYRVIWFYSIKTLFRILCRALGKVDNIMTFFKLYKTKTFTNHTQWIVRMDNSLVSVIRSDICKHGDYVFIIENTSQVLTPLYDSFTNELVGFTL